MERLHHSLRQITLAALLHHATSAKACPPPQASTTQTKRLCSKTCDPFWISSGHSGALWNVISRPRKWPSPTGLDPPSRSLTTPYSSSTASPHGDAIHGYNA